MVPLILESCAKSFKTPDLLKLLQREKRALKKKLPPGPAHGFNAQYYLSLNIISITITITTKTVLWSSKLL